MDGIMGHRANISPPLVLDSSTEQAEEGNVSYSEDVNMHHGHSILLYLKFILNAWLAMGHVQGAHKPSCEGSKRFHTCF